VAKLYYRDGLNGQEFMLLDPATLGKGSASDYSLDYFQPSWDGQYLAYGLSIGGTEASVLHVLSVRTGATQSEAIDRTSLAIITWRPDNRSFFYMRYPPQMPDMSASQSLSNARTYLHIIGENVHGDGDPAVFGRGVSKRVDVPEGQGTYIVLAPGSRYAIAVANHNMDQNPSTFYVALLSKVTDSRTPWRKLADVADGVIQIQLRDQVLYFLSQNNAPRFRLLATSLDRPDLKRARVIIPESSAVLTDFVLDRDDIYAREREGAVSRVRRVSLEGTQNPSVPLPFEGNIDVPVTDAREPGALMSIEGWLQSPRFVAYNPSSNTSVDAGLMPPSTTDTSHMESKEVFVVSYDGTRVPLSLLYRRGLKLDGSHPTLLIGYGSYGRSLEPRFNPANLAWLEHDGVIAIAHTRGGGEYGEAWHSAGQGLNKPNTILDFIACAQYLIDEHYTVPSRLAGEGISAGGITVGGAMTWRPDLFGVILDLAGMSDTLRSETEPNGPPNIPEFGSVQSETGFHGLYAMSAYAHVRDGIANPAVLFSTGVNDPRVEPWQMAKIAARMQAARPPRRTNGLYCYGLTMTRDTMSLAHPS
jgi:prolyl oligopeptidase